MWRVVLEPGRLYRNPCGVIAVLGQKCDFSATKEITFLLIAFCLFLFFYETFNEPALHG